MTVDPDALEAVLSRLGVRLEVTSRRLLGAGDAFALPVGTAAFVYVRSGSITAETVSSDECSLSPDATATPRALHTGDALFSTGTHDIGGRHGGLLLSAGGGELVVAAMQITEGSSAHSLPPVLSVSGFADQEPTVAALAASIGGPDAVFAPRSGDPVICQMIVTTLVLTLVRAWASAGCAPEGWPGSAADPYLECVRAAIHADPGRDWSLDELASVGAMSRTVFAERFRASYGRSPAAYVTDVRMQRAKEMLSDGHAVSETSRALGYASDEGFSRAFRRHAGLVPSRWRAQSHDAISA